MKAREKSEDGTIIIIPKHLNTPLDVLGQTVLSLILPATVKMALIDGHLCASERRMIHDYLAYQWGFNRDFIDIAISEQELLIDDFDYEQYRQLLIATTCANKEIKKDVIKHEILTVLKELMNADGSISPEEQSEFIKLSNIISDLSDSENESLTKKVMDEIKRRKHNIEELISYREKWLNKTIQGAGKGADFSGDLLLSKLRQLDENELRSLLVSGLRVSKEDVSSLSREELVLMISEELRSSAGSSCRNLFRGKHEFPYKQILIDVADRLSDGFTPLSWTKYKLDDSHLEREIEDTILNLFDERARKWWEKLPDKKKAEFIDGIESVLAGENLEEVKLSGGAKTFLTQQVIDNIFQYGVTLGLTQVTAPGLSGMLGVTIVGHIGWLIIVQTLGFMTGIKIAIFGIGGIGAWGHAISYLGGAAVGGLLSIPSTLLVLDGAAYRKTIPTIIMLLTLCRAKSHSATAVQKP